MANPIPEPGQGGALVAQAVERMAAAKIAVGLPPLGVLAVYGLVQSVRSGFQLTDHIVLMIGAVVSMAAMVAYGLQAVSNVLEKPNRRGGLIFAGSLVPILFGGYVIVSRIFILLQIGAERGLGPVLGNLGLMLLAVMFLRAQWKLMEVHLLAREMAGVARIGLDRDAL